MQLVETPPDPERATKRRRASTRAQATATVPAETPATDIVLSPAPDAPKPRRTRKSAATVAAEAAVGSIAPATPVVEAPTPPVEAVTALEPAPVAPTKPRRTRKPAAVASPASAAPELAVDQAVPAVEPAQAVPAVAATTPVVMSDAPVAAESAATVEPTAAPKARRARKAATPVVEAAATEAVASESVVTPAPVAVPAPEAAPAEITPAEAVAAKPRRSRKAAAPAATTQAAAEQEASVAPATETVAIVAPVSEPIPATTVAPAPKPRRTRSATAAPVEIVEAPKPRRARKAAAAVEAAPIAETAPALAPEVTASVASVPAETAPAPAKPRRTRKTATPPVAEAPVAEPVQLTSAPVQTTPEPAATPAKPRRTRQAAREAAAARAAEAAATEAATVAAAEAAVAPEPAAPIEWVPTVTRVRIVDGREERYEVPVGSDGPRKRRKVRRVRPAAQVDTYGDTYAGPTPLDPGPAADEPKVLAFGGVLMTAQTARSLADMGFVNPTEIQQKTIPLLLAGQDVVGQAQTGTGKTAAFGIPLVERIDPSMLVVQALVLAPTRELASQISDELTRIGRWRGVHVAAIYGGASMANQLRDLKRGAQVVVGTPGRILDHLKRGTLSFESVSYLVLDEADRMLDMGFMPDVERILRRTPRDRQTALFSATVPTVVRIISRRHMRDAVTVQCKPEQPTVAAIEQVYYEVAERDKPEALRTVLHEEKPERAMVFCRTQVAVDRLTRILRRDGIQVEAIHGSLGQNQRERVLADFRSGAITLLIATNLAARGLDIPEVSHVINYDIPEESESYVHRIGRTARMGREGKAITFVAEWDEKSLSEIKKVTSGALREERLSLYA